jgi:hypothetical protein
VAPAIRAASDNIGPGGIAFLVVVLLIVASIGIFFAMSRSLKSLRRSVNSGTFGQAPGTQVPPQEDPEQPGASAEAGRPGQSGQHARAVIPRPKRPDDEDA